MLSALDGFLFREPSPCTVMRVDRGTSFCSARAAYVVRMAEGSPCAKAWLAAFMLISVHNDTIFVNKPAGRPKAPRSAGLVF
jgi:hypothetical protein